jgi:hypothetical protein
MEIELEYSQYSKVVRIAFSRYIEKGAADPCCRLSNPRRPKDHASGSEQH